METILAGRYQIYKHLGGGGFGQTFLATDSHLPGSPLCVVKQLKPRVNDPAGLETAKRLFDREAETLYRLGSHDQIPRLLAHFEQEHEFYLVQEFIEGRPLDLELVAGKQFDETTVIALLQDVLTVLAFVHQQQVIHRDIKPANLIRRHRDNKIVLIDFGAVKEVNQPTGNPYGQTSFTIAIGSPGYMPIEQQSFKPHFSSDIYAVGIVCLRALTGLHAQQLPKDPRTDEFSCALLKNQVTVSPGLATILDRMVRYDYRQRYETALEALNALQILLNGGDPATAVAPVVLPEPLEETATLSLTVPPAGHQEKSVQTSSRLTDLLGDRRKALERLVAEAIGPIAPLLLKQALCQSATPTALIDRLATHFPEKDRATFRTKATRLLEGVEQSTSGVPTQNSQNSGSFATKSSTIALSPSLEPGFIKRCEQELATAIGPIAPIIVQRTLAKQPKSSPLELIEALARHVTAPEKADAFRKALQKEL